MAWLSRNKEQLKGIRSHLRHNMPAPEAILWQRLRNKQLGVKFRRQYSVDNLILDFYAPAVRLGIELDGESHYESDVAQKRDRLREGILEEQGIVVLRFLNNEIVRDLSGVIEMVKDEIQKRTTPSSSPFIEGGENV